MAFTFNFPDVGEGIHEGRVVEWLVAEGDSVAEDQALVKVETDKAVVELPSPKSGTVLKLHVVAEATIYVGDALVTIGDPSESVPGVSTPVARAEIAPQTIGDPDEAAPEVSAPASPSASAGATADAGAPAEALAAEGAPSASAAVRRPLATPRTRALARKHGVDLKTVSGTGSGGRITEQDVERAAHGSPPVGPAEPAATAATPGIAIPAGELETTTDGEIEKVPISHLRKVIAGAMQSSKQLAAHVTHVDEADVTELLEHYRSVKPTIEQQAGVKFSMLPFFIKALVTVLKQYPMFNASVDEEAGQILVKRFYNIGIAVDTPEGLIVPVVRNADQKDMVSLAAEVSDLAERARSRTLSLDELRGSTCTITNIGPLGGVFATPIINQPELAIVGLHAIKERPVVVDGEIAIREMMYLSVSFDHRWIDGADAARFAADLVRLVSVPGLLMVRL